MIDHRLSEDYQDLRKTVEEFAREQVAPVIGDSTGARSSRTSWPPRWGGWGCSGCRSRGVRRHGR